MLEPEPRVPRCRFRLDRTHTKLRLSLPTLTVKLLTAGSIIIGPPRVNVRLMRSGVYDVLVFTVQKLLSVVFTLAENVPAV